MRLRYILTYNQLSEIYKYSDYLTESTTDWMTCKQILISLVTDIQTLMLKEEDIDRSTTNENFDKNFDDLQAIIKERNNKEAKLYEFLDAYGIDITKVLKTVIPVDLVN
jgi:hypothetical protein